eukprot:TRINITY_DN17452_c0_g1_i2.p1 TRINITY_DN17452_c0_g1~~TRINITY_DN17452_c0_g1_i2.p1  ORF type:complete len:473 (+),score=75.67 TRINITY_DN17452_c0_g1_i2:167-1420(+)
MSASPLPTDEQSSTDSGDALVLLAGHSSATVDASVSPEARALLRAGMLAHKPRPEPTYHASLQLQADTIERVLHARKFGPHSVDMTESQASSFQAKSTMGAGLRSAEWCCLALLLGLLLGLDVLLLQGLPESQRSHLTALLVWIFVALACCMEVLVCAGPEAGSLWFSGYLMEILSSADNIFIWQLIFSGLHTPHRLVSKALFIGMLASIISRFALFLGPIATITSCCRIVSWLLGTWLVYAGVVRLLVRRPDECPDVTQSGVVRLMRYALGDRFGEFYDEEAEAIIVEDKKKHQVTLLGIVLLCLVAVNFLLSVDVVLAKTELSTDIYLNFSSSAIAMFAIRSLFAVVRDFFGQSCLTDYALAVIVLLMGAEMLVGHAVYLNSVTSCTLFASIVVLSVGISSIQGPCLKMSTMHSL